MQGKYHKISGVFHGFLKKTEANSLVSVSGRFGVAFDPLMTLRPLFPASRAYGVPRVGCLFLGSFGSEDPTMLGPGPKPQEIGNYCSLHWMFRGS